MQQSLTLRQAYFLDSYTTPTSATFGNCLQSALDAGYTLKTARNLTHLNPNWLSDKLGHMAHSTTPEQLTSALSGVINDMNEPTLIRLRAIDLMMKHYGLYTHATQKNSVTLNIDLSGSTPPLIEVA